MRRVAQFLPGLAQLTAAVAIAAGAAAGAPCAAGVGLRGKVGVADEALRLAGARAPRRLVRLADALQLLLHPSRAMGRAGKVVTGR